jgi:hypothetical protein
VQSSLSLLLLFPVYMRASDLIVIPSSLVDVQSVALLISTSSAIFVVTRISPSPLIFLWKVFRMLSIVRFRRLFLPL